MTTTWLTAEDRERIEAYLAKPAHARRTEDLVPGDEEPSNGN